MGYYTSCLLHTVSGFVWSCDGFLEDGLGHIHDRFFGQSSSSSCIGRISIWQLRRIYHVFAFCSSLGALYHCALYLFTSALEHFGGFLFLGYRIQIYGNKILRMLEIRSVCIATSTRRARRTSHNQSEPDKTMGGCHKTRNHNAETFVNTIGAENLVPHGRDKHWNARTSCGTVRIKSCSDNWTTLFVGRLLLHDATWKQRSQRKRGLASKIPTGTAPKDNS